MTILIPAYNPDEKLPKLLSELRKSFNRIVLVDDGSCDCKPIFEKSRSLVDAILTHDKNRGKGAALKTGLTYIGMDDVVTVDADGQHRPEDILKVAAELERSPDGLVLGVRSFDGKVPFRSRFGNFWTRWFFFLLTFLRVKDTQTGLRGIPKSLVPRICSLPGERYEFEMVMLADARCHKSRPVEVPIQTVYLDGNQTSHFEPWRDTCRIYGALFSYLFSSKSKYPKQ